MTVGLPPPAQRVVVAPVAVGFLVAGLVVAFVAGAAWLVAAAWVVVVLSIVVAVVDEIHRRRAARAWDHVHVADVAPHVDVRALGDVRHREGELQAINALRRAVPGVPLRRARDLVAELTGTTPGTR